MNDEFYDLLLDDYDIDAFDKNSQNGNANANVDDKSSDEAETQESKKRPSKVKFDADLLLQPKGIPLLKSETQHLKFSKKKGDEGEDLNRLMTYYTIWANNLYPSLRIKDFAKRIATPSKAKEVRALMNTWNQEYRERRQIRLDVRNELSGKTVGDEDGAEENQVPQDDDDESSEDDNRPLFFPLTNTNHAKIAATPKQRSTPKPKPESSENLESDEDEQPLFTASQKSNKRSIVLDDSSDDDDDDNDAYQKMSRSDALALIVERKRKREQVQREEEDRLTPATTEFNTSL